MQLCSKSVPEMSTLSAIILAAVAGGVLSLLLAAWALLLHARWVNKFIAFAVGALLSAAFLGALPHAIDQAEPTMVLATVLIGILFFFVLEKLVLWRHRHEHDHVIAEPIADQGRSGTLILIGDTFHNFSDGVLIAGAFLADFNLGVVTALAIIAHEVPQEVGDFLVLLNSGFSRKKALLFNLLSSLAMLAGGLLGYFALSMLQSWLPYILAFAAASMIYVAVADLIPGLHRKADLPATAQQIVLIALGVLLVAAVHLLLHQH